MPRGWTFGRRIAAGFTIMVVLTVAVGAVALVALQSVVSSKNRVINVDSRLLADSESLRASAFAKASDVRGYLLMKNERYLTEQAAERRTFAATLGSMQRLAYSGETRHLLVLIAQDEAAHNAAIDAVVALARKRASPVVLGEAFASQVDPQDVTLNAHVASLERVERRLLASAQRASSNTASTAVTLVIVIALVAVALAVALALVLTRALRRQIGTAVGEVNSSSVELQATANQQATSAKEQATAMSEITTTISELLATSLQIAESAQRVALVAEQTANAGRSGELTIAKAQEFITDVRRQVDVIVDHMLELGEKSQQIGIVLDIVTELAEQTNILAINSTIEAAGAGEAGKRFAVVADEIRKLADRVAESTKEIRGLIDVVRNAVNTTVMATEIGSKAVDAGSEQFANVASAFVEIAGLVETTNEAAREIELSTKQQATAVEQVNAAISDVAQSTKEAEAGSTQTFQTASQLTMLSEELARLVEPRTAG